MLWAYPPHDGAATVAEMIRLLGKTSDFPLSWYLENQPHRPLPTSPEGWATLAKEQRNTHFGALDLFLDSPSGLVMSLSVDAPEFVRDFDVLTVGIDSEHLTGPQAMFGFDSLYTMFTESIKLFRPFWAAVRDSDIVLTDEFREIRLSVDGTKLPFAIDWLNYFDQDMAERLGGVQKLLDAPAYLVERAEDPVGIILALQRQPFDCHDLEDLRRQRKIAEYLDLPKLHAMYPRQR